MALLANQLLLQKILKKPVNVDGSHIIDRSITFIDISLATIQGSNITNDTIDFSNLSTSAISSLTTTPPNSIDGSHIINRSITGIDIALETIKGENIQDRTITGLDIGLQEIKEENIVGLAVTELKIGGLAVTEGKIGALAVTEGKIGALAVTEGKIGALAVTDAKIATGTISLGKLSAGAISSLQTTPSNSIDSSHIIDGAILGADISAGTIDLSNLSTACISSLTAGAPAPNSINSSHIIDGAILGTDISDRTITASNIVLGTITKFEILDGTITGAKIGSSTIEGGNIAPATIEYNNLSNNLVLTLINSQGANTINTTHILDGTILGTDIQAGTITSNNIQDGTITGTDIQSGTITATNIQAGTITSTELSSALTTQLASLQSSVNLLLANALIMSSDTIVNGTTGNEITIPIDLVNNESVTINFVYKLFGANFNGNEVYISYKTSGNGYNFDEARAITWVHNGNVYAKTGGAITQDIAPNDLTNIFTIKMYRSFTSNTPSERYFMEGEGSYTVANQGNARVEYNGMVYTRIPDAIYITHGPNYSMSARYSIINNPG